MAGLSGNAAAEHDLCSLLSQTQHWLTEVRKPEVIPCDGYSLLADDRLVASHWPLKITRKLHFQVRLTADH